MTTLMRDISDRVNALGIERRSYAFEDIEIREDSADGFTFEGVASVVDHPYPVADQFGTYTETIRSGAFDASLRDKNQNVALHVNHGWRFGNVPLATRAAKTLTLMADPNLRVRASIDPARPDAVIVRSAVRRGELPEMSVGFKPVKSRDKWDESWTSVVRTQVNLIEASIVEAGANTGGTTTSVRNLDELLEHMTDVDMSEADIRRGFAHFESLVRALDPETPADEPQIINPFADRDRQDRERLERKRHAPIPA
jgi:HK97 family phage prohead protease